MDPTLARVLDEAQAKQLPALIADWQDAPDDRRWIARALRIDLALLTERPELVVPCLYRRCAFAADDEAGFYRARTDAADRRTLRALVRGWAAYAPRPWLRALRPPMVPLDGAVVEEYRTSVQGTLWISDDGERIGVAGEDAHVAWDRVTGRRVDGARARHVAPPAPPAWELPIRDNTWGRLVLERGDQRIELAIGDDAIIRYARTLDDDLVLVFGDELETDDFFCLVDTRTARVRWRARGRVSSSARLDAKHVIVATRGGIETIELLTGNSIGSWSCVADDVLPLPDGNVATRTGNVIRVWDVLQAVASPQVELPSTNSWTPAAFSPDGKKLVTGQLLCDAEGGRFIAYLDCNGPSGWLEGGPPRNCQRLCNSVFVEIMPFGLTLWDTHDGKQVIEDRERRARTLDTVAFDPSGSYHAIWSERGTLQLYRLLQGTLVTELEQPVADRWAERTLGFTPDGARLCWENAAGERWAIPVASPGERIRLAADDEPWERRPARATVEDGVLVAGGTAIPIDDEAAIASGDGRQFAWVTSHYQLEPA